LTPALKGHPAEIWLFETPGMSVMVDPLVYRCSYSGHGAMAGTVAVTNSGPASLLAICGIAGSIKYLVFKRALDRPLLDLNRG
jgi:hypothetical protein